MNNNQSDYTLVKFVSKPCTTLTEFVEALEQCKLALFDWQGKAVFEGCSENGGVKAQLVAYAFDEAGRQKVHNSTSGDMDALVTETVVV